jgi:hypothetical protein
MPIRRELIDELLQDYPNPQDILAEGGLYDFLSFALPVSPGLPFCLLG